MSSTARCVPRREPPVSCRRGWLAGLLLAATTACHEAPAPPPPAARPPSPLSATQVRAAFPDGVGDPAGWARPLPAASPEGGPAPAAPGVGGVAGVLQGGPGFQAAPPVPNLGALVRSRLKEESERYGPLGPA